VFVSGSVRIHAETKFGILPGDHSALVRSWCFGREMVTELTLGEAKLVYLLDRNDSFLPWRGDKNSLMARFCGPGGSGDESALFPFGHVASIGRRFRLGGSNLGEIRVLEGEAGAKTYVSVVMLDRPDPTESIATVEVYGSFVKSYGIELGDRDGNYPSFEFECSAPFAEFPSVPSQVSFVSYDFTNSATPNEAKENVRIVHRLESIRALAASETFESVVAEVTRGMRKAPPGESEEVLREHARQTIRAAGGDPDESVPASWMRKNRVFLMVLGGAFLVMGVALKVLRRRENAAGRRRSR